MKFNNLKKLEVAAAFSVNEKTIYDWVQSGMPKKKGGYNLPACIQWRLGYLLDKKSPTATDQEGQEALNRYRVARASIEEFKKGELEKSLIPADEVKKEADFAGRLVKQRVTAWPGRVSPLLAPVDDQFEIEQILIRETRSLLEEISGSLP